VDRRRQSLSLSGRKYQASHRFLLAVSFALTVHLLFAPALKGLCFNHNSRLREEEIANANTISKIVLPKAVKREARKQLSHLNLTDLFFAIVEGPAGHNLNQEIDGFFGWEHDSPFQMPGIYWLIITEIDAYETKKEARQGLPYRNRFSYFS
jgi:hypothetical protein